MRTEDVSRIEALLAEVFSKSCPGDPMITVRRAEQHSGITLLSLTRTNLEAFLSAVGTELRESVEEWKANFLLGVIRRILAKYL